MFEEEKEFSLLKSRIEILRAMEEAGIYNHNEPIGAYKKMSTSKESYDTSYDTGYGYRPRNTDLSSVHKLLDETVKAREDELKAELKRQKARFESEIAELKKDLKAVTTERNTLKRRTNEQGAEKGVAKEIREILGTFNGMGASTKEAVEIVMIMSRLVQFFVENEIYYDQANGAMKKGYKTNARGCSGPYGLRRVKDAADEACQLTTSVLTRLLSLDNASENEEDQISE